MKHQISTKRDVLADQDEATARPLAVVSSTDLARGRSHAEVDLAEGHRRQWPHRPALAGSSPPRWSRAGLEDQVTPYTELIATRLLEDRASAPALWELELTNVLRASCLRRRLTAEKAQQILLHIAGRPIDTDRPAAPRHELLALTLHFRLSSYDATYLELALYRQLPLAAQDKLLRGSGADSGGGLRRCGVVGRQWPHSWRPLSAR